MRKAKNTIKTRLTGSELQLEARFEVFKTLDEVRENLTDWQIACLVNHHLTWHACLLIRSAQISADIDTQSAMTYLSEVARGRFANPENAT